MLISTKGRYALRVLIDMAEHNGNEYIKLKDIAERQEISEKYLESIVKQLVNHHIVVGLRGKGGGYKLSKAADEIVVVIDTACWDSVQGGQYSTTITFDAYVYTYGT